MGIYSALQSLVEQMVSLLIFIQLTHKIVLRSRSYRIFSVIGDKNGPLVLEQSPSMQQTVHLAFSSIRPLCTQQAGSLILGFFMTDHGSQFTVFSNELYKA